MLSSPKHSMLMQPSGFQLEFGFWNAIAASLSSFLSYKANYSTISFLALQLRSLSSPGEIAHNDDILRIFLMACEVKTVKLSVIGLSCLQKLISHDAVAPSALKAILSTLKDVSLLCMPSVSLPLPSFLM